MLDMNSVEKYLKFQTTSYVNLSVETILGLQYLSSMVTICTCSRRQPGTSTNTHLTLLLDFHNPVLQQLPDLRSNDCSCADRHNLANR